jgi:hypothetical protein
MLIGVRRKSKQDLQQIFLNSPTLQYLDNTLNEQKSDWSSTQGLSFRFLQAGLLHLV